MPEEIKSTFEELIDLRINVSGLTESIKEATRIWNEFKADLSGPQDLNQILGGASLGDFTAQLKKAGETFQGLTSTSQTAFDDLVKNFQGTATKVVNTIGDFTKAAEDGFKKIPKTAEESVGKAGKTTQKQLEKARRDLEAAEYREEQAQLSRETARAQRLAERRQRLEDQLALNQQRRRALGPAANITEQSSAEEYAREKERQSRLAQLTSQSEVLESRLSRTDKTIGATDTRLDAIILKANKVGEALEFKRALNSAKDLDERLALVSQRLENINRDIAALDGVQQPRSKEDTAFDNRQRVELAKERVALEQQFAAIQRQQLGEAAKLTAETERVAAAAKRVQFQEAVASAKSVEEKLQLIQGRIFETTLELKTFNAALANADISQAERNALQEAQNTVIKERAGLLKGEERLSNKINATQEKSAQLAEKGLKLDLERQIDQAETLEEKLQLVGESLGKIRTQLAEAESAPFAPETAGENAARQKEIVDLKARENQLSAQQRTLEQEIANEQERRLKNEAALEQLQRKNAVASQKGGTFNDKELEKVAKSQPALVESYDKVVAAIGEILARRREIQASTESEVVKQERLIANNQLLAKLEQERLGYEKQIGAELKQQAASTTKTAATKDAASAGPRDASSLKDLEFQNLIRSTESAAEKVLLLKERLRALKAELAELKTARLSLSETASLDNNLIDQDKVLRRITQAEKQLFSARTDALGLIGKIGSEMGKTLLITGKFYVAWLAIQAVIDSVSALFNELGKGLEYARETESAAISLQATLLQNNEYSKDFAENLAMVKGQSKAVVAELRLAAAQMGVSFESLLSTFKALETGGIGRYVKTTQEAIEVTKIFQAALDSVGEGGLTAQASISQIRELLLGNPEQNNVFLKAIGFGGRSAEWQTIRDEARKTGKFLEALGPQFAPFKHMLAEAAKSSKAVADTLDEANKRFAADNSRTFAEAVDKSNTALKETLDQSDGYLSQAIQEISNVTGALLRAVTGLVENGAIGLLVKILADVVSSAEVVVIVLVQAIDLIGVALGSLYSALTLDFKGAAEQWTKFGGRLKETSDIFFGSNKKPTQENLNQPFNNKNANKGSNEVVTSQDLNKDLQKRRKEIERLISETQNYYTQQRDKINTLVQDSKLSAAAAAKQITQLYKDEASSITGLENELVGSITETKRRAGELQVNEREQLLGTMDGLLEELAGKADDREAARQKGITDIERDANKERTELQKLSAEQRLAIAEASTRALINLWKENEAQGLESSVSVFKKETDAQTRLYELRKRLLRDQLALVGNGTREQLRLSAELAQATFEQANYTYLRTRQLRALELEDRREVTARSLALYEEENSRALQLLRIERERGKKTRLETYDEEARLQKAAIEKRIQLLEDRVKEEGLAADSEAGKRVAGEIAAENAKLETLQALRDAGRYKVEQDEAEFQYNLEKQRLSAQEAGLQRELALLQSYQQLGLLTRLQVYDSEKKARKELLEADIEALEALVRATEPTDEALSQRLRDLEALRDQLNKLIKTTQVERPGVASATDISKQKAGYNLNVALGEKQQAELELRQLSNPSADLRGVLDSILDTRRKELETLAALYKADAQRKTPGSQERAEADALTAGTEKSILDLQKQRLDNMLSGVENPIIRAVRSYQLRRDSPEAFGKNVEPTFKQAANQSLNRIFGKDAFEAVKNAKGGFEKLASVTALVTQGFQGVTSAISTFKQGFAQGGVAGGIGSLVSQNSGLVGKGLSKAFKSLGSLGGPLAESIGAALSIVGALFTRGAKLIAESVKKSFEATLNAFREGNTTLVSTLAELQRQRAEAIARLSGRKGGKSELDKLLPDIDKAISDLKKQQKEILTNFEDQLGQLRLQNNTLASARKTWQDINKQIKEYIDAGGAANNAAEMLSLRLQELRQEYADELSSAEQDAIQNALRLNDLLTERNKIVEDYKKQAFDLINADSVERRQAGSVVRGQQLADLKKQTDEKLSAIDREISAAQRRKDKESEIFNLAVDIASLHRRDDELKEESLDRQLEKVRTIKSLYGDIAKGPDGYFSSNGLLSGVTNNSVVINTTLNITGPVDNPVQLGQQIMDGMVSEFDLNVRMGTA